MNKRMTHIYLKSILTALLMLSFASPLKADESMEYSMARGGRLYDKWFNENGAEKPKVANPAYPAEGKYKGKKASDWRCKECHGWDYKGKDGAYSAGKHYTGIKGIQGSSSSDPKTIIAILRDKTHAYSKRMLSDKDAMDLANFVSKGQIDFSKYIDSKSKQANGNAKSGQKYYQTVCVACHGLDGKGEDTPPLGKLSNKNPWEVMHKIQNGQPQEGMPALRAFDVAVTVDIVTYMQQGLPKE